MPHVTVTSHGVRATRHMLIYGATVVVLAGALAVPAQAVAQPALMDGGSAAGTSDPARWTPQPPLRRARVGLSVATVNGTVVAVGGFDHIGTVDTVEARRLTGPGTWQDVAPLRVPRSNSATAEAQRLIYTAGGFDSTGTISDVVEVFDPKTGRWTDGRSLPQRRAAAGAASLNGLIYVAGGTIISDGGISDVTDTMIVYNPVTETWRAAASMVTARDRLRLVAANGYLYAIGGQDRALQSVTAVERYDPGTNSWRAMAPLRESRAVPCAVETRVGPRHLIFVAGGVEFAPGDVRTAVRRTTEVFNVATGQWTLLKALMPYGRGSLDCAVQPNGTVLAIGGATPTSPVTFRILDDVDSLSLKLHDLDAMQ
jgi:N-acetylneuraminic acid mutarotase